MCGIGLWHYKNNQVDTQAFGDFMKRVQHRGPDFQQAIQVKPNLIIGSNRLAIIDVDPRSNQPFQYKDFTVSFNGAIYNYKTLRSTLQRKGHSFVTDSDTEVIVHAYEEYGEACTDHFDGMWAFCIYDPFKDKIFISRDRFNIKPLYYVHNNSGLFVASEEKQFRSLPSFEYRPNETHIQYYLESGGFKNYNTETVINDVYQLQGGHNMIFDCAKSTIEIKQYYKLSKNPSLLDMPLEELISTAIKKRLVGDIKPAVLFSGGLDSSIITKGLYSEIEALKSYSFIEGRDKSMDESPYIQSFLQQFPHENHQVVLPKQLKTIIKDCIYIQDEPPASLSTIAQFILYKLAKNNGEKLMMSGQGADEIFGGYPRFLSYISPLQWFANPVQFLTIGKQLLQRINSSNSTSLFSSSPFKKPQFQGEKDYMEFLLFTNGLRDLLHYEDRNSMAAGIETRLAFMDRDIVEYAYTISTSEKLQGAKRKGILLETYKNALPSKIINRKTKLAFDTPEKFLLQQDFIDVKKEFGKLKDRLPNLSWQKKDNAIYRTSEFTQWQVYFTNVWLDSL